MPQQSATKNLCLIIPALGFGGAERVFVELANAFVAEGYIVNLVVLSKGDALAGRVHPAVNLFILQKSRVLISLPALLPLIRKIKPQVIISTLAYLNIILGLCRRIGLLSCDTLLLRETSIPSLALNSGFKSKILLYLYRAGYMGADWVIAQSQFMKNDIEKLFSFDPDRICVIHNPVDVEIAKKHSVATISFSHQTKTILFVGQLRAEKQIAHILRALTLPPLIQVTLHIVGDGEQREFLESQVLGLKISNRVIFHGSQPNPFPYMKEADLVVLSSAYEGFPNVLIEAIAVGTPICSYRCPGGVSEIICAENGLLVDPCTPEALSTAIRNLLESSLTADQIQRTALSFKTKNIVEQYATLF